MIEQRKQRATERGTSVFEVAVVALLTLGLLYGAVGVSDVLMTSYRVARAVDLVVYDHRLSPLRMDPQGAVVADEAHIRRVVTELADRARTALQGALVTIEGHYRMDIEVAIVSLDPRNGTVQRIRPLVRESRGVLSIPQRQDQRSRLDLEYERVVGRPGDVSHCAVPLLHGVEGEQQFLPLCAVIGARVFVSYAGSPTARALERLGILEHELAYDWKAVPVRGDIGAL